MVAVGKTRLSTPFHIKYFAHEVTRLGGGSGVDRLSQSLFDACVDLNPHQIDAALFAMRSPLSKGVLLADEVGLGKTIEAGLVICQSWAERRRKILVITPASLRKQWSTELEAKFNIPSTVMDAAAYREALKAGNPAPFLNENVVIMSMHFVSSRAGEVRAVPWDLVVIDEAHKLRNAYRQNNRMGQNIRWATEERWKVLLTATPLQNSLLELYGLASLIDEHFFGDLPSFRSQYTSTGGDLHGLRDRIKTFCKRTLRSQVLEYVRYTERKLITRPFQPGDQEHQLYEAISEFLQRPGTYALPLEQRHLTTLIVRKLLASSSQALAGTLEVLRARLVTLRDEHHNGMDLVTRLVELDELEDELLDELLEAETPTGDSNPEEDEGEVAPENSVDMGRLNAEIMELDKFIAQAHAIGIDTKTRALVTALQVGFDHMESVKAPHKAVIFTESRRTQAFLCDFLESNGYGGKVVTFNGTNKDAASSLIYERWQQANRDSGRASGSRAVDMRSALLDHFENQAEILIATEAAAEGLNLQFCALVINYDLPWNPQRIEQRIGRCHRYGQKHDVVVINFLNERNAADLRVYELLNEKFNLFSGIFGASDEVLGTVESGMDFERRVLEIYQTCRTEEEIESAFQALRSELEEAINTRIQETRQVLLEHFDEDVHARLKVNLSGARERLDRIGTMFWTVTEFQLRERALFDAEHLQFTLHHPPAPEFAPGTYHLISKTKPNVPGTYLYRLSHPLGEHVLQYAKALETPCATVNFNLSKHPTKIGLLNGLKGHSGWLTLQRLVLDSYAREEYLLFSAFDSTGRALDQETCEKLFVVTGTLDGTATPDSDAASRLEAEAERHLHGTLNRSLEANNRHFQEARDQLEKWADDMVVAAEKALKDTKEQIKALNRQARQTTTLEEQREIQERIRKLETQQRRQRQEIFEVEDDIIQKRDALIENLERRLVQKSSTERLFTLQWRVV